MSMIDRLNAALEGRYRIERELGEGGMATVYLAADLKHNRRVAMKVLKPELAAVVGPERFLKEIETTAALQHPHILPLFDSGEADGFLFYVMPFVQGESLRERLDRDKQLPVDQAAGIAAKLAGALQTAHASGVIHRDIKPANILLADGEPLIADFGIALAVQEAGGGRLTETGLSVGTPFYMSPEQATADRAITPATDIYALGCVLYEMLVGEPPYVGNTAQAVLGKILTDDPRRPSAVRPRIPPHVEAAVMRALEKLPADRFATAGDFLRALEDPGFRYEGSAEVPEASRRGGSSVWPWVAAGLGFVVIAQAVTQLFLGGAPPAQVVRVSVALPGSVVADLSEGVGVEVNPTGDAIVFRAADDGGVRLWLHRLDELEPEVLPDTERSTNPRFSPDGQSLVFLQDDALRRVGLDGSPPVTIVPEGVLQRGLVWGDDGFIYFRMFEAESFHRVPASGGTPVPVGVRTDGEPMPWWPEILPGGRVLVSTIDYGGPAEDSVVAQDLESGRRRVLFQGAMARWASSGHLVYADADGTILTVPFDPDRLEVTGPPRSLVGSVRVNPGSAAQFAVSRSGALVYGPGGASPGTLLYWFDETGKAAVAEYGGPKWSSSYAISPDGRKIAMSVLSREDASRDIWVLDLDSDVFARLTFRGENFDPFWHPDSQVVGFLRESEDEVSGIYRRPIDLSREAEFVWTVDSYETHRPLRGRWTPDGSRLVVNMGLDSLVTVAPHPDSVATSVISPLGSIESFELSPNGDWIAYESDESGQPEVYLRPFPGPGGQRQLSSGGGRNPRWLASGEGVVYVDEETEAWMVARFESASDPGRVSTQVYLEMEEGMLVPGTSLMWDLAPDGRVLVNGVERGGQRPPVVVTNWFTEWVGEGPGGD